MEDAGIKMKKDEGFWNLWIVHDINLYSSFSTKLKKVRSAASDTPLVGCIGLILVEV